MIKVLTVDDHDLIRTAIKSVLKEVGDIQVIGEAATGEEAVLLTKKLAPDVVIIDIDMPGIGGLGAIPKILYQKPNVKILILTIYQDGPYPTRLLETEAHGYLAKGCQEKELIKAVRTIYSGQRYIDNAIAQKMLARRFSKNAKSPFDLLTKREFEIILMITKGEETKDIAKKLHLSVKTIHTYRSRIHKKLNIHNDRELILLAVRFGIINTGPEL